MHIINKRTEEFDIDDVANEYCLDLLNVSNNPCRGNYILVGFIQVCEANEIAEKYGLEFVVADNRYNSYHADWCVTYKGKWLTSGIGRSDADILEEYEYKGAEYVLRSAPNERELAAMLSNALEDYDEDDEDDAEAIAEIHDNADNLLDPGMYMDGYAVVVNRELEFIDNVSTDDFDYTDNDGHRFVLGLREVK